MNNPLDDLDTQLGNVEALDRERWLSKRNFAMNDKGKSVLDGRTIVEKGFPLRENLQGYFSRVVVGGCPKCAALIYAEQAHPRDDPKIVYTCECNTGPIKSKNLEDTISTK